MSSVSCNALTSGACILALVNMAQRIKQAREAAGINQSDLAKRLGLKPQSVQHWERDSSRPKGSRLQQLASILGVDALWLLTGQSPGETGRNKCLTADEWFVVDLYRRMPKTRKAVLKEVASALAQTS